MALTAEQEERFKYLKERRQEMVDAKNQAITDYFKFETKYGQEIRDLTLLSVGYIPAARPSPRA